TDLQAVLDAIVQRAARLMGARIAFVRRLSGDRLDMVSAIVDGEMRPWRLDLPGTTQDLADRAGLSAIAVLEGRTLHRFGGADAIADELPAMAAAWRDNGVGSGVAAPLLTMGGSFGAIMVSRLAPEPFTPAQVDLLEAFAAQAAIAIENTRLFTEL